MMSLNEDTYYTYNQNLLLMWTPLSQTLRCLHEKYS